MPGTRPILGVLSATRRPQTTIVSDDEDSAYPATNLKVPRSDFVTRTLDNAGGESIVFDFKQPMSIGAVTVVNHNWAVDRTVWVQLSPVDSWGPPPVTETLPISLERTAYVFDSVYQYRFACLRIIADEHTPAGYSSIGTIDWWVIWESDSCLEVAAKTVTITDPSTLTRARHGDATERELVARSGMQIDFNNVRRAHALELKRLLRDAVGSSGYVWFCEDPADTSRSIYGPIMAMPEEAMVDPAGTRMHMRGLVIAEDV